MKASELISILQQTITEHGDLDVTVDWERQLFLLEDARCVDVFSREYPDPQWIDPVTYPNAYRNNRKGYSGVAGIFVARESPGYCPKRICIDADSGYSYHENIEAIER